MDTPSEFQIQLRVKMLEGDGASELDLFRGFDSGFKVGLNGLGVARWSVVGGGRVDVPEVECCQHLS